MTFVYGENAFDSVDRYVIRKLTRRYCILTHFTFITQKLRFHVFPRNYEDAIFERDSEPPATTLPHTIGLLVNLINIKSNLLSKLNL